MTAIAMPRVLRVAVLASAVMSWQRPKENTTTSSRSAVGGSRILMTGTVPVNVRRG